MKAFLRDQSLLNQLIFMAATAILGALVFTGLGLAVAMMLYDVNIEGALNTLNDFPSSSSGHTISVFKIIQAFATIGSFLVPGLLAAYAYSPQPMRFLGLSHFPRPLWQVIPLLLLLSYSAGIISDSLYRLSAELPWPDFLQNWHAQLLEGQERMFAQYSALLEMNSALAFLGVFFVMAVLPAVGEELLFRGSLQPLLVRSVGKHAGIALTAFAFSLLHQQVLTFLSIFSLGVILGYLREWSRSLWLPIIVHLINNGSIVVLAYFMDYSYSEMLEGSAAPDWSESLYLSAVFAVSLLGLYHVLQKNPAPGERGL